MRTVLVLLLLAASPAVAQVPEAWRTPDSLRVLPLPDAPADSLFYRCDAPGDAAERIPIRPGPCDAAMPMPEMPPGAVPPAPMPNLKSSGPPPVPIPNLCDGLAAAAPDARVPPPVRLRGGPRVPAPGLPVVPRRERE